MSGPLYAARPPLPDPRGAAQVSDLGVSSRLIHLEPGLFSLALMPGTPDRGTGLPGARICLPPSTSGRREAASISTLRGDGWMTANDEPTLLRVPSGGADILVTLYWSAADPTASPPALKLMRLNLEETAAPTPTGAVRHGTVSTSPPAEIVAHVEGVGDVDGKLGEWVGMRGSGRAVEGFSLTPRNGIATEDFAIRAVLGRDWLSPWLPGGSFCGSRGLALPLRGFCVRVMPAAAARLEFACFARFVDGSEIGPVGSDLVCATASLAALEAFQILLRPRVA